MATFRKVMWWGFGRVPRDVTEASLREASTVAYTALAERRLADAVREFCALPGVGPSRATKLLALSSQATLGIYDSSAAAALNQAAGGPVVPEPPAQGSTSGPSQDALADGFARYTDILRALHDRASNDEELAAQFGRVSDIELALFAPV